MFNNTVTSYYGLAPTSNITVDIPANYTAENAVESVGECTAFRIRNNGDGEMYFLFVKSDGNEYAYLFPGTLSATYPATITFTTPFKYSTDPEFYLWFTANASKASVIEQGTYTFNSTSLRSGGLWTKGTTITQNITAKSNGYDVSSIILLVGAEAAIGDGMESGVNIKSISYALVSDGMTKNTQVNSAGAWTLDAYKTIEITEDCVVDEKFKQWFEYYTTKQ